MSIPKFSLYTLNRGYTFIRELRVDRRALLAPLAALSVADFEKETHLLSKKCWGHLGSIAGNASFSGKGGRSIHSLQVISCSVIGRCVPYLKCKCPLRYLCPSKYTSLRAAEKVVHFKFVYIEIEYT